MNTQAFIRRALLAALVVSLTVVAFGAAVPAQAASDAATVDVDALNLRAGPGFRYIVLKVLAQDQSLRLLGRSADSVWVEVRLPDGSGGWVYAAYIRTEAALSQLPVTQAAGGPTDPAQPAKGYSLSMTIVDNQAVVTLQKYPANAEVVVKLGRAGAAADLAVAQGVTDASGSAQFSFAMPRTWADGKPLIEADLVLVAGTADGKFSRSASIQYYR